MVLLTLKFSDGEMDIVRQTSCYCQICPYSMLLLCRFKDVKDFLKTGKSK